LILTIPQWPAFISELYRVLKPGYIRRLHVANVKGMVGLHVSRSNIIRRRPVYPILQRSVTAKHEAPEYIHDPWERRSAHLAHGRLQGNHPSPTAAT